MKTLFVHGRPEGHPLHSKYGRAASDNFEFEDPWIRWHDKQYPFYIRYFAWVVNSFAFIRMKKTVIVTEGLRITIVLSKVLSFGAIRLIALVDDESPYFIRSGFYSKLSYLVNKWAYNKYDGWICIGEMETKLVKEIVNKPLFIATGFNGVSAVRLKTLLELDYSPSSRRIVFIGNGPASWRMHYKGLDLMLSAFSELIRQGEDLYFDIGGEWDIQDLQKYYDKNLCVDRVTFHGRVDPVELLKGAALYLHVARGEAWGITINEAMAAGVVPLVSEWTGAQECVAKVSSELIIPIDKEVIIKKVKWFFALDGIQRSLLSEKCKAVAPEYTEEAAVNRFRQCFFELRNQLTNAK